MPRRLESYAKLNLPRLYAPIARGRLFTLIDEARAQPVVWIVAPGGAGKTTLAATYVRTAGFPFLWYQIDRGDSDPASFFYYLRHACRPLLGRGAALPLLTPEYLGDVAGFARRFFRTFFLRCKPGSVLVFDNYHEVDAGSALHEALAAAIDEIPDTSNVVVLSRADPPCAFARAVVTRSLLSIGWDALRLTHAEAGEIAGQHARLDSDAFASIFALSEGWPAGLVLLLEQIREQGPSRRIPRLESASFDAIASQVFEQISLETREFLMETSCLQSVSVDLAERLTGNRRAREILDSMHKRGLLVDRRPGVSPTYQYHALFRSFLHDRVIRHFTDAARQDLLARAGTALVESGDLENGFMLLCDAGAWDAAANALTASAPQLIGQGRLSTLEHWATRFPQGVLDDFPWVVYWLGMAIQPVRPKQAIGHLQQAFDIFAALQDRTGQMMCAAGVVHSVYLDYSDFQPMDRWVEIIVRILDDSPDFPSQEAELRVYLALLSAVQRLPGLAGLTHYAARVEAMLDAAFDVNLKVVAGARLISYADAVADLPQAQRVARQIEPLLASPDVTAANVIVFHTYWGYHLYVLWRIDDAIANFDRCRILARQQGLGEDEFRALAFRALCQRRAGRLQDAQQSWDELMRLRSPEHGMRYSFLQLLEALIAYSLGDLHNATRLGTIAQRTVEQSGNVFNSVVYGVVNAGMLIAHGRLDDATTRLTCARSRVAGTAVDNLVAYIAINEAHVAHLRGDVSLRDARLAEALEYARTPAGRARLRWYPEALSVLLPIALEEGIQPAVCRQICDDVNIAPAMPVEAWPWPAKIHTLGTFRIFIAGQPLQFERKVPKKALAVLQVLIALGGREVREERIAEALWPDEEGDLAIKALGTCLHRLRKLLGQPHLIRQSGGKLSIDLDRCWIDALAFERMLSDAQACASESNDALVRALRLYRGAFLASESEDGWMMAARERLRGKFIVAVSKIGQSLEARGQFREAEQYYARGLEVDGLVEGFYQGLMRCCRATDRVPEAVKVYRRLTETLSAGLGVAPSRTSERLYRELRP